MRPVGIGDIAVAACRDSLGCWGWIEAYRNSGDRPFETPDLELLAHIGPGLGSALRRDAIRTVDGPPGQASPPGTIVLDQDLRPVSWTAGARAWIDALPAGKLLADVGMLPAVVYPAATLARSGTGAEAARALVQALDGRWVMIEAARLEGERDGETAVTLRAAAAPETFTLLCRVYALSQREREVVAFLVAGFDTRAITEHLFISHHTVQDHLRSVFEKTGIHSRRQLLATLATPSD